MWLGSVQSFVNCILKYFSGNLSQTEISRRESMLQITYDHDKYIDFSRNVQTCLHHVVYLLLCHVHSLQVSTKNEILVLT